MPGAEEKSTSRAREGHGSKDAVSALESGEAHGRDPGSTVSTGVMGRLGSLVTGGIRSQSRSPALQTTPSGAEMQQQEMQALQEKISKMKYQKTQMDKKIEDLEHLNSNLCRDYHEVKKANKGLEHSKRELTEGYNDLLAQHKELDAAYQQSEKDARDLDAENVQYKMTIAANTRIQDQTTDDAIAGKASEIYFALQNFAVQRFRKVQFEYGRMPEAVKMWACDYIPNAHRSKTLPTIKVAMSIICKTLTDRFAAQYCFGAPEGPVVQAAATLAKLQRAYLDTKQWLEMTRKLIQHNDARTLDQAQEALIRHKMIEINGNLQQALAIDWTENAQKDLAKVISMCLDFFRLLHRQSAAFQVEMASNTVCGRPYAFDPEIMEEEGNDEEEAPRDRDIEISIFPGVYKWGNERGENEDQKTVISKAKVVLQKQIPRASNSSGSHRANSTSSSDAVPEGVTVRLPISNRRTWDGAARRE